MVVNIGQGTCPIDAKKIGLTFVLAFYSLFLFVIHLAFGIKCMGIFIQRRGEIQQVLDFIHFLQNNYVGSDKNCTKLNSSAWMRFFQN